MAERKKKPEQSSFEGVETLKIPSVTNAARKYVACREERMEMQVEEKKLKSALTALMEKHSLQSYKSGDVEIVFEEGEATIKVKANRELPPEPENGDA